MDHDRTSRISHLRSAHGLVHRVHGVHLFRWTPASIAKARDALHIARWFWLLAGVVATIGAALTHITHHDMANIAMPLIFLAIFVALAALR